MLIQQKEEQNMLENDGQYEESLKLDPTVNGNEAVNFSCRITNDRPISFVICWRTTRF